MSDFIEVRRMVHNDEYLVNIDAISWIHPASNTICVAGISGGEHGLLSLTDESIDTILEVIGQPPQKGKTTDDTN